MSESWARVQLEDGIYHILPVTFTELHDACFECWCCPDVRHFEDGNIMVSHFSADDEGDEVIQGH